MSSALKDAATRLLGFASRIGAKDVLVWIPAPDRIRFGLVAPALTWQRMVGSDQEPEFSNHRYALDAELQRALGLNVAFRSGHIEHQTMTEGMVTLEELLSGMESALARFFEDSEGELVIDVTLLPSEGAPWSPKNDPTRYYSAKKRKEFVSEQPAWLMEVEARDPATGEWGKQLGANPCLLLPQLKACGRAFLGLLATRQGWMQICCSHALEPGNRRDASEAARMIRDCGGLLMPSLAVGPVPAPWFGSLVLLTDPATALASMKPFKKRGASLTTIYDTDAWTAVTATMLGSGAVQLYQELTGNATPYPRHFWMLGAPIEWQGGFGDTYEVKTITNASQLAKAVAKRMANWPRDLPSVAEKLESVTHGADRYPFVESKVNAVMPLGCFTLAVVPRDRVALHKSFLQQAGYSGPILVLERDAPDEDNQDARWAYAWAVYDALEAFSADEAARTKGYEHVRELA